MLSHETDSLRSWRSVSLLTSGSGCWPQCKVKTRKTFIFFGYFYINLSWIYGKLVKIQKVTVKKCPVGYSWFGLILTYYDSSRWVTHATTHATGTQIVRAKTTSLDAIFLGETSRTPALSLAFCAENMKHLPREATRSWKKIWARLVGKST